MEKVFVVVYEFEKPTDNYESLVNELQSSSAWWHYMKNVWLVRTNEDADELFRRVRPHIDDDVNLLILEAGSERQGWLTEEAWEWINENIPQRQFPSLR